MMAMGARSLWILLPLGVGIVAAACVNIGCWTYWGPVFALSVALVAQAIGRTGGLVAAGQSTLLYDYLILPPVWDLTLDYRTLVMGAMFAGAALLFYRKQCGCFIGERRLNNVRQIV